MKEPAEVQIVWQEERRCLTLEGETVLEYVLCWPKVEGGGLGGRWISRYYAHLARSWRQRWEREVYWAACLELAARREEEVLVTQSDHMIRLSASQIKYIEISGHRMVYHTTGGEVSAYGNLKEVEAALDPAMFARCNSCYLVNLNYVQAIQGYTVLVGGESLQISRPRRRAFAQALNDYLGGGIT